MAKGKTNRTGWSAGAVVFFASLSTVSKAQTITTAALADAAPTPVPVDHPLALLALIVGVCALAMWWLRRMGVSLHTLRNVALGGTMLALSATALWGDAVLAQLLLLQRQFTQASGETLAVPVQAVETGGVITGFAPVEFSNTTGKKLRVKSIVLPTWDKCFPTGVPTTPVATASPPSGTQCAVNATLDAGKACWVDVSRLCADAAAALLGNSPSVLAADAASVNEGQSISGNVLANDSDADGPLLVASYVFAGVRHLAGASASQSGLGDFSLQADGAFTFAAAKPFLTRTIQMGYTTHTGAVGELTITVNRTPTAVVDNPAVTENQPMSIAVLANDSDVDGDVLSVSAFTQGAHGSVVKEISGNLLYTPDSNYFGSDSFSYTASDGKGLTATASVNVTINPVNHAPVTSNVSLTVQRNGSVNGGIVASDVDGDTLSYSVTATPVNGVVGLSSATGSFSYTPSTGFSGSDSFSVTVSDGKGGSVVSTVTVAVVVVNAAPIAVNDTAKTAISTDVSIPAATLLSNDTDPDGDTLTVTGVGDAVNGTVSLSGGNVKFTPAPDFEGLASFTYTISDGKGGTSTATVQVSVGSAVAPALVVMKALVINAHSTDGASVKFPIITKLVDTDGSESLTAKVSGVPMGVSFNAGTNLGAGVWRFEQAELSNLTLNVPGSYTTNATHLTVQVTSTEANGGATASVSSVVTVKAAYTTVDGTTTQSGGYTGSPANEFIQGGSGDNTIDAGSGNNFVYGGEGNDNLSAGAGSDVIYGGAGNDIIDSGSGADVISGGPGNDTLKGGGAGENDVDVFVWELGDQGAAGTPAIDTILNFATAAAVSHTVGGDVLNLRDLLQGESIGPNNDAGNLADYLHFEISGSGDTRIHISHAGGFGADSHSVGASFTSAAETQTIVLSGVNLQSLYSNATTDQQIIKQLLNNNKLIVD